MHQFLYFDLEMYWSTFAMNVRCVQMGEVSGLSADDVREVVFTGDLEWQYERGEISCQQFFETFCELTGADCELAPLREAASAIFVEKPDMGRIVDQLSAQGHALGVLSNTNPAHWEYVRRAYPMLESFRRSCIELRARMHEARSVDLREGGGTRRLFARGHFLR